MNTDILVSQIVLAYKKKNKVLTFGVGGNMSNAMHFAAELAGKYEQYEDPLSCIALGVNPCELSAITNDFGWEYVFSRQIRGIARPGDVIVAFSISTGGKYLLNALDEAASVPCEVFLICGRETKPVSLDITVLDFDSLDTPHVQEEQLKVIHQVCGKVKGALNGK